MADVTTLQMALVGYQYEKQKIEERIREIEAQLKGKHAAPSSQAAEKKAPGVKRVLSPAARKRIAAAQKKRWAEHRKRMAAQAKGE
jgi:cell division septum initiation protein DivIVA